MESLNTSVGNVVSLLAKSSTSQPEPSTEAAATMLEVAQKRSERLENARMPVAWVERLFERLAAILGAKMADIVAGADPEAVKEEWSQALGGYSDDELRRGIAATRTRRFPPNLPEFLHLCRPALDPETAWLEAVDGMAAHQAHQRFGWSHPAVYWAAREVQFELRSGNYAACRKRWDRLMAEQWSRGVWASPPDPTHRAVTYAPRPMQSSIDGDRIREKLRRDAEELRSRGTHEIGAA